METTRITHENGAITGTNYMLDEIIDLFESKGLNNGDNDDLIKTLACQKMDYARRVAIQVAVRGDALTQATKLNKSLKEQIVKLGHQPREISGW